jgi:hypothetical protein
MLKCPLTGEANPLSADYPPNNGRTWQHACAKEEPTVPASLPAVWVVFACCARESALRMTCPTPLPIACQCTTSITSTAPAFRERVAHGVHRLPQGFSWVPWRRQRTKHKAISWAFSLRRSLPFTTPHRPSLRVTTLRHSSSCPGSTSTSSISHLCWTSLSLNF